jgi:hypothetical protein
MKLISDILNLSNTKYAIQLKESGYIIWKFKRKWKVMGEVFTKQQYNNRNQICEQKTREGKTEHFCKSIRYRKKIY